jgi:outer membrane lipoprotein-sorting protein
MHLLIALLITAAGFASDPVSNAINNFEEIESYRVTLISGSGDSAEIIRYYYRRPGFVKMELIKPHRGTVLAYSPRTKKVTLVPFSWLSRLKFTLDPDNKFIRSSGGHRIDESDIGALLKSVSLLQKNGKTRVLGEEFIGKRPAVKLDIKGEGGFTVDRINAYHLWLDRENYLPLKAVSFDVDRILIEEVLMDDLQIDVVFPDNFFDGDSLK